MINPLGWALIHSLWQSVAIAILFAAFQAMFRKAGANTRYVAGYIALLAMPACAIATFFSLTMQHQSAAALSLPKASFIPPALPVPIPPHSEPLPYLALVVWVWMTGVIAMSVWAAAGWTAAQRLKRRGANRLPEIWQARMAVLARRLRIRRGVRLCETALAQVPSVIGWIRPVILIPAGALLNLSREELEAVIAHELAHIRRYDYLANLLQTAIEVLMFYHPAVWWIGKRIRAERENCCDDLAIAACGDRVTYARALTALEEIRGSHAQFAIAAAGGSLVHRIRRVLGKEEPRRSLPIWIALAILLPVLLGAWSTTRLRAQNDAPHQTPAGSHRPTGAFVRPGYLAGLVDAGYTDISVDEIIELKNNGVSPEFIKGILQSGISRPSPKALIALRNSGLHPGYARAAGLAHIPDLTVERIIYLHQNGVNLEAAQQIHALGFGPYTPEQLVDLRNNGALRPDLFEALKESGYAKVDARQAIDAMRNGLSPGSLRSLREQRFSNLTLEQVVKLKRAGVI